MPFKPDTQFVGRRDELKQLADALHCDEAALGGRAVALLGECGIGKTSLATELVYRYGRRFKGVFWIDCSRPELIPNHVACAGYQIPDLDIAGHQLMSQVHITQRAWAMLGHVLIVLDNCESDILLKMWRPKHGAVLVTSSKDLEPAFGMTLFEIQAPAQVERAALLQKRCPKLNDKAAELDERVGDLPLALHVAASCLNQTWSNDGLSSYLATFSEQPFQIDETDDSNESHENLVRALAASYGCLRVAKSIDAHAIAFFASLSQVAPEMPMPIGLLPGMDDQRGRREGKAALKRLTQLGLIQTLDKDHVMMHRLTAEFADQAVDELVVSHAREALCHLLYEQVAIANRSQETDHVQHLLPHFTNLLEFAAVGGSWELAADMTFELGIHYRLTGAFELSERWYRWALEHVTPNLSERDDRTILIQNQLGQMLQNMGKMEEAAHMMRVVLESHQAFYPAGHPHISADQSNLALVLKDLGRLDEARELLEAALESDRETYEPGHPNIAMCQSNLALVLLDQGNVKESAELLESSLDLSRAFFKPGSSEIAICESNLASAYKEMGRIKEAAELLESALVADISIHGMGHPRVIQSQSNLGMTLRELGDLKAAREYLQSALDSDLATYGPHHPEIAIRQSNLALVLRELGELAGSRKLMEAALKTAKAFYEPGHPEIAVHQSNLALVLQDQGHLREARELLEAVLLEDTAAYEEGHPHLAMTQSNLGAVLQEMGELDKARPLLEAALASDTANFGPEHVRVGTGLNTLSYLEFEAGNLKSALDYSERAWGVAKSCWGETHPNTLASKEHIESIRKFMAKSPQLQSAPGKDGATIIQFPTGKKRK